jgi:hypothetical protein
MHRRHIVGIIFVVFFSTSLEYTGVSIFVYLLALLYRGVGVLLLLEDGRSMVHLFEQLLGEVVE